MKEKHVDLQVLQILVQATVDNKEDARGIQIRSMATNILKLFGRLTSQVTNNPSVWENYADLMYAVEEGTTFLVVQTLQKAYRSAVQIKGWEKDMETCMSTLNVCQKFIENCLSLLSKESTKEHVQLANSAKLSIFAVVKQVKNCYDSDIPLMINNKVDVLELKVNELVSSITSVSAA